MTNLWRYYKLAADDGRRYKLFLTEVIDALNKQDRKWFNANKTRCRCLMSYWFYRHSITKESIYHRAACRLRRLCRASSNIPNWEACLCEFGLTEDKGIKENDTTSNAIAD